MANPPLIGANGTSLVGAVANPIVAQNPDGTSVVASMDRQGALLTAPAHGTYGVPTARDGVFFAAITTAAQAIPVITTTNASTFCLINPVGSGVNCELIDFQLDFLMTNAAPATANVVGFSFVDIATNAHTSITKAPVPLGGTAGATNARLGGPVGSAYVATAVTFASALTIAANWGYPMFSFPASWVPTVGGYPIPLRHSFNGRLILPPGKSMTLVASTAWAANTTVPSMSWAEYKT